MIWRIVDTLLLKLARRMEHLALHYPSNYREQVTRSRGIFAESTIVSEIANVQSVAPPGSLVVGDHTMIAGEISLMTPGARCAIGSYSFLGSQSRLWIQGTMTIGNFVLIAPQVDIFDNDSHPLDATLRREDARDLFERNRLMDYGNVAQADVTIEDDVWIGTKCIVLKGVRIGQGAVIGAGSVVTKDVAPFTVMVGNPAQPVKSLPR